MACVCVCAQGTTAADIDSEELEEVEEDGDECDVMGADEDIDEHDDAAGLHEGVDMEPCVSDNAVGGPTSPTPAVAMLSGSAGALAALLMPQAADRMEPQPAQVGCASTTCTAFLLVCVIHEGACGSMFTVR